MRSIQTARALGEAIRRARNDQGLTQARLAEKAGVGRPWISELESGKQTAEIGRVMSVLDALGLAIELTPAPRPEAGGVDLDELIDGSQS